ncbi:choline kinase family protein [Carboxydothermus ferrireducens]|uniref:Thiamine kinase-like enzyme n=1 Tax=Carboxydothermus ferrireducens DSM 11255 TaxID=1119529 RepID=A0ABX2RC49_9THEO|nr:choline kinase family protein [Carboxydothermus ferrireducens]NYE58505.1 thiamine kinase-like enzyme [Carboxydothermus ferrireducens DSM 11255]
MVEKILIDESISLEHVGKIYQLVSKVPEFKNSRINQIEILPGGLTNSNYKVTISGVDYALRIAGAGTAEYINRPAEKHAAQLMAELGINAEVIYYDETTGDQICRFIHGKTLHIPDFHQNEDYIVKAAKVFRKFHESGLEFLTEFNLLQEMENYKNLLIQKNYNFYDGAETLEKNVAEVKKVLAINPPKLAPCHNDPLCENWIDNGEKLFLIDWEYCGMNDPMFDLAALVLEADLNEDQERLLLRSYYDSDVITKKQYGSLIINKFLCDALWSYWAVLQIATGKPHEEYWHYGLNRFNRALTLVANGKLQEALTAFDD